MAKTKCILSILGVPLFSVCVYLLITNHWSTLVSDIPSMAMNTATKTPKSAVLIGYTGAVGKEIVKSLRNAQKASNTPASTQDSDKGGDSPKSESSGGGLFSSVSLIGRRNVDLGHGDEPSLKQVKIDFEDMQSYSSSIVGRDVAFCALGTTRSKSGADGFRKVDHDYIVNFAKLAKAGGIKEFHLVSSMAANHASSALYLRTKGEVEEELKTMNFDQLFIYQPGFLLADRDELRIGEWIISNVVLKAVNLFIPDKYQIRTDVFADAIVKVATSFKGTTSSTVLDNKSIVDIANDKFKQNSNL